MSNFHRLAIVQLAGVPNVPGLTTYTPPPDPKPAPTVTAANWLIALGAAFALAFVLAKAEQEPAQQFEYFDADDWEDYDDE